jgi:DNA-binding FadR family transcriptional regulator
VLQRIDPQRQYRLVADQIVALIAAGEFPSGSRLPTEHELASRLGVTRASLRDAIISLEMRGLLEVRVGAGIFVTAASPSMADSLPEAETGPLELLSARLLIEGEIAALAAREATGDDIAALRGAVERMARHLDDFAIREECDRYFHVRLAGSTRNGSLQSVVEGLWDQRAALWGRMEHHFHTKGLAEQTIRDHAAVVQAVAARDAAAARGAMHRHLSRVAKEFQRGVEEESPDDARVVPGTAKPRSRTRRPTAHPR